MPELLLELFSEEIPARMQVRAADDLKRLVTEKLLAAGLHFQRAEAHSTPRRLALAVEGLPARQADVREERKGPRVGSPEQALQGFLRGAGLTDIAQAEVRDTGKGAFYFAVIEKPGGATLDALPGIIDAVIRELPWPKSMRWGANRFAWVRPLHSILAVFDGQVVPGALPLGSEGGPEGEGEAIPFGNETEGHRFLSPGRFAVERFADYKAMLRAAHVILDREERKRLILEQATAAARAEGLRLKDDPGLLEEVAGLVEWPVVLVGSIDTAFMDVPPEVLTTSMRTHQRYFALETADGRLAPRFVVVANRPTADGGKAVIQGNERVLRARLSDAKFFWDQDRKVKLEDRLPALDDITFHAKLGSMKARVDRIEALAGEIARALGWSGEVEMLAQRAARLCKADLVTGVVGEFPEVQGIMGRYYALGEGEHARVAEAIADHYKPLGPGDRVPTDPVSVAVALAEKIDTLVGFFGIDEKPTGSRDPFALRRAALGVIRLVVENGLRVRLGFLLSSGISDLLADFSARYNLFICDGGETEGKECRQMIAHTFHHGVVYSEHKQYYVLFGAARDSYTDEEVFVLGGDASPVAVPKGREWVATLLTFFADRLKVALKERGVRHDLIDAVFALGGQDDLVLLLKRVEALGGLVASEDGANLLTAYRRAANILRIEEKKDGLSYGDAAPEFSHLTQSEEVQLHAALAATQDRLTPLLAAEDFTGAMQLLAGLRAPVDAFFEKVTVNAPEPALRANRLRLLAQIRATMDQVADFGRIEG